MDNRIQDLLILPFRLRTFSNQVDIVRGGVPRPKVNTVPSSLVNGKDESIYQRAEWITACLFSNSFYCWPCLLFNYEKSEWNQQGVTKWKRLIKSLLFGNEKPDLDNRDVEKWNSLFKSMSKHEMRVEHIQADLDLKMFYFRNVKPLNSESKVIQIEDLPEDNQETFKFLINVVCNIIARECPPDERDGYSGLLKTEVCVQYLNLVRSYGTCNIKVATDALELIQKSREVLIKLVKAIVGVLKLEIKKEVSSSTYVSILMSQHSNVANQPIVSTVLRYLKNGKVHERFIGFVNPCGDRVTFILKHIVEVLAEYDISDKFLSYSLDGGIFTTEAFLKFKKAIQEKYPSVFFVHWYAHSMYHVLEQSLSNIEDCYTFFKIMDGIKRYFENTKRVNAYNKFMIDKHYRAARTCNTTESKQYWKRPGSDLKWLNKDCIVITVHKQHYNMLEFFDFVLEDSSSWNEEDVTLTFALKNYLIQLKHVFLVEVLNRVFNSLLPVIKCLTEQPQNIIGNVILSNYVTDLKNYMNSGFHEASLAALNAIGMLTAPANDNFEEIFLKINDCVITEITARFKEAEKLDFTQLLLSGVYKGCANKNLITANVVLPAYGFDNLTLNCELEILEKNVCFIPKENFHHFFVKSGTCNILPSAYKLSEFCWTLPIVEDPHTTGLESGEPSDPLLGRIQKWSNYPYNVMPEYDKTILNVEIDLLQSLMGKDSFYQDVLSTLVEVDQRCEEARELHSHSCEESAGNAAKRIKLEPMLAILIS